MSKITVLPYNKMKDYSVEMHAAGEKKLAVVAASFSFNHFCLFVYKVQKNIPHTYQ